MDNEIDPKLEFKIATKEDLAILNALYADMYDRDLMPEQKISELWYQIQQVPEYNIYLAYFDKLAIGTFSLILLPTMIYPGFHKSAILDVVTIHSNYRGKSFGTQMIKKALSISANAGCYKVTLSSNLKRDRAHRFYKSLGFRQHGWSFSYQFQ